MKTFKEFISEKEYERKLYMQGTTLWFAYGSDSGTTAQVSKQATYLTNKRGDKNYNQIIDRIVKEVNKIPKQDILVVNDKYYLFKLPVYDVGRGELDIWSGVAKPITDMYASLNKKGVAVLTFFKSKSEAMNWVK